MIVGKAILGQEEEKIWHLEERCSRGSASTTNAEAEHKQRTDQYLPVSGQILIWTQNQPEAVMTLRWDVVGLDLRKIQTVATSLAHDHMKKDPMMSTLLRDQSWDVSGHWETHNKPFSTVNT